MKAKRNAFAALGWVVWKVGAALGIRYAQRRLDERRSARHPPRKRR